MSYWKLFRAIACYELYGAGTGHSTIQCASDFKDRKWLNGSEYSGDSVCWDTYDADAPDDDFAAGCRIFRD